MLAGNLKSKSGGEDDMARPKVSLKGLPKKVVVNEDTKFYIDYMWWEESGRSIEGYLSSRLGTEIEIDDSTRPIDLIDPETGEVRQMSGFEFAMQSVLAQLPADYAQKASVVDSAFIVLMGGGNQPMSAAEISEQIARPVDTIYKTLGGNQTHQGIRVYNS